MVFENQIVTEGAEAVPDARISGYFTWWFETKTSRGGYGAEGHDRDQLKAHAARLASDPDALLFVLTPDPVRPTWFESFDGPIADAVASRIIWLSFRQLDSTIEEIATEPARLLGEQTRFLLSELVQLFETDGLLTNDDTVFVAARRAWRVYRESGAYTCQPNRAFREGLTHLGFYAESAIQPLVPTIRKHLPAVLFTKEEAAARREGGEEEVARLVDWLLANGTRVEGESYGGFLLSSPDSDETVKLDAPVANDSTTAAGKPWAWTLGQRYTSIDRLASGVRFTSQL